MSTVMVTYIARHEPCNTEVLFTNEARASQWLKVHSCPRGVRSAGSIRAVVGLDPAYSIDPRTRLREARNRQNRIEQLLG